MSVLYTRVLLWHKLLAVCTGGLALCSAKHRLNRDEATGWSTAARNVADDIDMFLANGTFILDERGRRIVESVGEDESRVTQEVRHVEPSQGASLGRSEAVRRKLGGLRVATRKKQ